MEICLRLMNFIFHKKPLLLCHRNFPFAANRAVLIEKWKVPFVLGPRLSFVVHCPLDVLF